MLVLPYVYPGAGSLRTELGAGDVEVGVGCAHLSSSLKAFCLTGKEI